VQGFFDPVTFTGCAFKVCPFPARFVESAPSALTDGHSPNRLQRGLYPSSWDGRRVQQRFRPKKSRHSSDQWGGLLEKVLTNCGSARGELDLFRTSQRSINASCRGCFVLAFVLNYDKRFFDSSSSSRLVRRTMTGKRGHERHDSFVRSAPLSGQPRVSLLSGPTVPFFETNLPKPSQSVGPFSERYMIRTRHDGGEERSK
jgi:hypothetical protein